MFWYFVLFNNSFKFWSIIKTRDSFGICSSWGFQNCPWKLDLTKICRSYWAKHFHRMVEHRAMTSRVKRGSINAPSKPINSCVLICIYCSCRSVLDNYCYGLIFCLSHVPLVVCGLINCMAMTVMSKCIFICEYVLYIGGNYLLHCTVLFSYRMCLGLSVTADKHNCNCTSITWDWELSGILESLLWFVP